MGVALELVHIVDTTEPHNSYLVLNKALIHCNGR